MARELELSLRPIFSTPLVVFSVPDCQAFNDELKQAVLAREASLTSYSDREVIGWSSPHDLSMMEWAGKPLTELFKCVTQVAATATEFSERTGKATQHPSWQVVEIWANVQRHGGTNGYHAHPGSFWSGVYYVDVGDITDEQDVGGELQLFDPRGCLPRMLAPYLRYAMPELHDAGNTISLKPSTGQCVMFPGWQAHAVAPYRGKNPRISIAFNLDPILHQ
ncbi:MAG TPA: 2OG-Fe(II) oxygenase family protein [Nitrospira sp.]|nr:2OG-Fe(II) oxygenase family protein [Nitrospira sp.]